MEWNHVCFRYTNRTSNVKLVSNGDIIHDEVLQGLKSNPEEIPLDFISNFAIMKQFYGPNSMLGKMTDVNIWNISLDTRTMTSWTKCARRLQGQPRRRGVATRRHGR